MQQQHDHLGDGRPQLLRVRRRLGRRGFAGGSRRSRQQQSQHRVCAAHALGVALRLIVDHAARLQGRSPLHWRRRGQPQEVPAHGVCGQRPGIPCVRRARGSSGARQLHARQPGGQRRHGDSGCGALAELFAPYGGRGGRDDGGDDASGLLAIARCRDGGSVGLGSCHRLCKVTDGHRRILQAVDHALPHRGDLRRLERRQRPQGHADRRDGRAQRFARERRVFVCVHLHVPLCAPARQRVAHPREEALV